MRIISQSRKTAFLRDVIHIGLNSRGYVNDGSNSVDPTYNEQEPAGFSGKKAEVKTTDFKRKAQLAAGTLLLISGICTLFVGAYLMTLALMWGSILGPIPFLASFVGLYGARSLFRIKKLHFAILGPIALIFSSSFAIWTEWDFLYTMGLIVLPLSIVSLLLVLYSWTDLRERHRRKNTMFDRSDYLYGLLLIEWDP
jgi:hypothetical protein